MPNILDTLGNPRKLSFKDLAVQLDASQFDKRGVFCHKVTFTSQLSTVIDLARTAPLFEHPVLFDLYILRQKKSFGERQCTPRTSHGTPRASL